MFRKTGGGFVVVALIIAGSIWAIYPPGRRIPLGIDLRGGFELLYRLDTTDVPPEAVPGIAAKAKEIVAKRLDKWGLKEISISVVGNDRLLIQIPGHGTEEVRSIRNMIETAGVLNFHIVAEKSEQTDERKKEIEEAWRKYRAAFEAWKEDAAKGIESERPKEPDFMVSEDLEAPKGGTKRTWVLENREGGEIPVKVPGNLLRNAYPTVDRNNSPAVGFEFGSDGATLFSRMTGEYKRKRNLAIVLDKAVVSAPTIRDQISTRGIITGNFTDREVRELASILRVGSLPAKPILEQQHSVGAVMGRDSVMKGVNACILGMMLVVAFMAVYYMAGGVIAVLALFFNLLLILAYVGIFRQTITFPGVAGIVLTVGMAVDANILVFERIREELKKGKSLLQSMGNGYRRAFWTIFDANLTTFITAVVLFKIGTGAVKGFAVTLMAGLIANFFTALFFTRLIFSLLYNRGLFKRFSMLQAFETPSIRFIGHRHAFLTLSVTLILIGLVVTAYRGSTCLGIDFTGGTRIMVGLAKPLRIADFRAIVRGVREADEAPFRNAEVQAVEGQGEWAMTFTVRTRLAPEATVAEAAEKAPAPASDRAAGTQSAAPEEAKEKPQERLQRLLEVALGPGGRNILAPQAFPVERLRSPLPVPEEEERRQAGTKHIYLEVNVLRKPVYGPDGPEASEDVHPEDVKKELDKRHAAGEIPCRIQDVDVKPGTEAQYFTTLYVLTEPIDWDARDAPANRAAVTRPIKEALQGMKAYDVSEPFPSVDSISGKVAGDMQANAFFAIIVSMVAIVFYVGLRFEFNFGVAAIAALAHDVFITLGILVTTDWLLGSFFAVKIDLPVVAAFLTIIGYSLNDTIVVFDRIRENMARQKKESFEDLVDRSVNQTLSRTLWTSATTFAVVTILLVLGGEPIRGFAYSMVIGVVVGTYSSIFIASPVLIYLRGRKQEKAQRARETARAAG